MTHAWEEWCWAASSWCDTPKKINPVEMYTKLTLHNCIAQLENVFKPYAGPQTMGPKSACFACGLRGHFGWVCSPHKHGLLVKQPLLWAMNETCTPSPLPHLWLTLPLMEVIALQYSWYWWESVSSQRQCVIEANTESRATIQSHEVHVSIGDIDGWSTQYRG